MTDLVKRLRAVEHADVAQKYVMLEAASHIEELEAVLCKAREALTYLMNVQPYSKGWSNGVTDATGSLEEAEYWHGEAMNAAIAAHAEIEKVLK